MKLGVYTSFITIALSSASCGPTSDNLDIRNLHRDFDRSMQYDPVEYEEKFADPTNKKYLYLLRKLYQNNHLQKAVFSPKRLIPLRIHQIQVGNRNLPESNEALQRSWRTRHPDWEYTLWTDEKIKTLQLKNQKLYDETNDPLEKTNILRYEILYQFGGVCVDIGTESFRSLEPLHSMYNFYTGIAPVACKEILNTGIIAAAQGNLIIEECLRRLPDKAQEKERTQRNGSAFFTEVFCSVADIFPGVNIAFPPNYFSPTNQDLIKTSYEDLKFESFALYYWSYASELPQKTYHKQPENYNIYRDNDFDIFDSFFSLFDKDVEDDIDDQLILKTSSDIRNHEQAENIYDDDDFDIFDSFCCLFDKDVEDVDDRDHIPKIYKRHVKKSSNEDSL